MTEDEIATLRDRWLDRKVTVNVSRSELERFAGLTGQVKAVNFNGHCLVQFDHGQDISWYDLSPADLRPETPAGASPPVDGRRSTDRTPPLA